MCDCDFDVTPIVEELKFHRSMFPTNGFRALVGRTYENGKQPIKEVPVIGLMWNEDQQDSSYLDLLVWIEGEARPLRLLKDCPPFYAQWVFVISPTDNFDEEMQRARKCLTENKADDLEMLTTERKSRASKKEKQ